MPEVKGQKEDEMQKENKKTEKSDFQKIIDLLQDLKKQDEKRDKWIQDYNKRAQEQYEERDKWLQEDRRELEEDRKEREEARRAREESENITENELREVTEKSKGETEERIEEKPEVNPCLETDINTQDEEYNGWDHFMDGQNKEEEELRDSFPTTEEVSQTVVEFPANENKMMAQIKNKSLINYEGTNLLNSKRKTIRQALARLNEVVKVGQMIRPIHTNPSVSAKVRKIKSRERKRKIKRRKEKLKWQKSKTSQKTKGKAMKNNCYKQATNKHYFENNSQTVSLGEHGNSKL